VTRLAALGGIRVITFDFGNTLVPVDRAGLGRVVERTADEVVARLGPFDRAAFLEAWAEERERQFAEEVPRFREVDLEQRFVRVLARLRGYPAPPRTISWDDEAAQELSDGSELSWAVETYSRAFVDALPAPPQVGPLLARLRERGFRLAILSNWPLAATVDRYVEAAGWAHHLSAVVISQRVGTIKPHPRMFATCRKLLGQPDPSTILHVGDDWAADVIGAKAAGWRVAYVRGRPEDSPMPSSERDGSVVPDLEIDRTEDLAPLLLRGHATPSR
jgi:HAD superfamily hydrolase (TIGR01509 family)